MELQAVAIIGVFAIGVLWGIHHERRRRAALRLYWTRDCAGRAWRNAFPEAESDSIREFLRLVVDAFAFDRKHALRLAPSDTLLSLYRASNPDPSAPDSFEIETLNRFFSGRYGQGRLDGLTLEVTFGELFARAVARPNTSFERTRER
jgi:hypothetical protein